MTSTGDICIMFLKERTITALQKETEAVLKDVKKHPIIITRQTDDGYVLMTKAYYAQIMDKIK